MDGMLLPILLHPFAPWRENSSKFEHFRPVSLESRRVCRCFVGASVFVATRVCFSHHLSLVLDELVSVTLQEKEERTEDGVREMEKSPNENWNLKKMVR